ncbi:hypothetical protein FSP39_019423 [Pinctada imbricata]|uniref:RRM domain-containing protein n=1 Tax=Pinctada imbricata TaxID=66713 RepID=A0AA89BTZ2_PINIB|nr:hypothetical protein FSP39_019423 [Pinctada imbricata]
MNSIRVNGLSKDRTLEELKVYFSKPKNGGGRINKIYYPLLNNDAVIVYEDEDVATQVLSVHDHDVYGDAVDVLPLPISVFTEVQASLDPGVASMIKTTYQCEDRLRYICEVEIVTDDNHNVCLRGDVYQIEMAWKVISHFLQLQRQIHSSMLNSAEKLKMEDRHNIENGMSATSSSRARRRQRQEESRQSSVQGRGANGGSHVHDTQSDSFRQNGQTYGAMDFTEEERYDSHKYSTASREEDKPKIIPRRSLQNDASRPLTQPGAETSEYRQSEIDRIIKQTREDRANRSKNSSLRSNDSMSKIGPSQVESIDIPPVSSHNHFTGQREALHEHDYLSLGSRYGESLSHAFPQNHADSSGDESLQARGTGRLSDANDTFEKFSSLKVSSSPGQSDKSTSKSKRK